MNRPLSSIKNPKSPIVLASRSGSFAFFCLSAFILFYLYTFIPVAHAQTIPTSVVGVELTASTNSPAPGENVTITAESYSIDIDSANITWSAGGQTLAHGVGLTTETVQAPALGKRLTVDVTAVSPQGISFNNSITLGSGSIDLIIEPDGYAPPYFLGKDPVVYQNDVKIVAMPHLADSAGVEYDPSALVYQWQKDGSALADQSGYGKQSIDLPGDIVPRPYVITVNVATRDGSAQGTGLISVSAGSPSIMFYDDDPLYGPLYNRALGDTVYVGSQRELGVIAAPYGFDIPSSGLSLSWLINGTDHPELDANDSITLRAPAGAAGSSNVELDVTNSEDILQQASAAFAAAFSADTGSTDSQPSVTF